MIDAILTKRPVRKGLTWKRVDWKWGEVAKEAFSFHSAWTRVSSACRRYKSHFRVFDFGHGRSRSCCSGMSLLGSKRENTYFCSECGNQSCLSFSDLQMACCTVLQYSSATQDASPSSSPREAQQEPPQKSNRDEQIAAARRNEITLLTYV